MASIWKVITLRTKISVNNWLPSWTRQFVTRVYYGVLGQFTVPHNKNKLSKFWSGRLLNILNEAKSTVKLDTKFPCIIQYHATLHCWLYIHIYKFNSLTLLIHLLMLSFTLLFLHLIVIESTCLQTKAISSWLEILFTLTADPKARQLRLFEGLLMCINNCGPSFTLCRPRILIQA